MKLEEKNFKNEARGNQAKIEYVFNENKFHKSFFLSCMH